MGRTLLRRSGIPGAWLRCSITAADGEYGGDEASLGVGEEEVEAEAACISLAAGIFELETLAMALISGLDLDLKDMVQPHTTTMMLRWYEGTHRRDGHHHHYMRSALFFHFPLLVSTILS
jgi:hypothetical protein